MDEEVQPYLARAEATHSHLNAHVRLTPEFSASPEGRYSKRYTWFSAAREIGAFQERVFARNAAIEEFEAESAGS